MPVVSMSRKTASSLKKPFPRRGDAPHSLRTEKRIPVGDALPPHALLRLPADAVKEDEGFGDHREERKRTV